MNGESLISIVVPVYNVQEYLEECVFSIIAQTYSRLEIILVNDGSTDESGLLCEKISQKDSRIKVLHKENGGLSDARNVGVACAGGEYIVFVDSDDVVHPQMIQILYEEMIKNNAELSFCAHRKIQSIEEISFQKNISIIENNVMSGIQCIENMYSDLSIDMVVAWNKMYKREYLVNHPYPLGRIHEDEFITYKVLFPLQRCVYIKSQLYYYRQRKDSITQQKFNLRELDLLDAYEERKNYFKSKGLKELYLIALCRYQTVLAEMIIDIFNVFPDEKEIITNLRTRFFVSWKEEVRYEPIGLEYKLKYILFMISNRLYAYLKGRKNE